MGLTLIEVSLSKKDLVVKEHQGEYRFRKHWRVDSLILMIVADLKIQKNFWVKFQDKADTSLPGHKLGLFRMSS